MAETSKIGWTGGTWNPWIGCTPVSAGCDRCYMFRSETFHGHDPLNVHRSKTLLHPLKWEPRLVFTCSLSDWFHEAADAWRAEAWSIVRQTPQHRYQILTKRPQRILDALPTAYNEFPNVWLGVSVENNKALHRIRYFERLAQAGKVFPVRFVSFEPLLEEIDLDLLAKEFEKSPYQWAIIGGESGTVPKPGQPPGPFDYRPCDWFWMQQLIIFHWQRGVPVFFKQFGTHLARRMGLKGAGDTWGSTPGGVPDPYLAQEYPADFLKWQQENAGL